MISPTSITDFNRTERQLQVFWLFCIMVAGKNSDQTATKLSRMLQDNAENELPFDYFRANPHAIHNMLVAHKIGQYGRIEKAIQQSLDLDLRTATVEELMGVYGVGPKTARFFVLHSRADATCAVLDTHVLKWLKVQGALNVPDSTPPEGAEYERLGKLFLFYIKAQYPGLSVAEADLLIWSQMSGRLEVSP